MAASRFILTFLSGKSISQFIMNLQTLSKQIVSFLVWERFENQVKDCRNYFSLAVASDYNMVKGKRDLNLRNVEKGRLGNRT